MTERDYDAIVIGAGIAGLGVSALLGKAGRRVLTLERAPQIGGRAFSFDYRGHTLNIGGPRVCLEGGRVDELYAAVGVEDGGRAFFDEIVHYRDGRFMPFSELLSDASNEEQAEFARAMNEVPEDEFSRYDDISATDHLASRVKSPALLDLARYGAVAMCAVPRLEDVAASTLMKAVRTLQRMPRPYLCVRGYGDSMRILAEASQRCGGELETTARVHAIVIEDGRVRGVVARVGAGLDARRETFDAPLVVTAFPIGDLLDIAPREAFPPEFVEQIEHLKHTTAVFGITAALREPAYREKYCLLTDAPRAGYPLAGYMASNVAPSVSPEGEHLLELSCICDLELGDDRQRLKEKIELMKQDVDDIYPGWQSTAIWVKPYFHRVESARTPGREGIHRPGPRAPGVEGLYFTGDSVSSRALPGLEAAAESAMICGSEILAELP